ncbi:restriction endonuclease subunit S [Chryseobacterium sp. C3]|uniref:restriction endonuclease subunit S n=1 Tax=Chryseobacterium sp. C3 TaxID=2761532 RepID=UPI0016251621|nr:restriction endonuclease subunit S [Chryseobacterium sp. C3]
MKCIDDEIPFEIPESWEWCRWKNLFQINPKNTIEEDLEVSFVPMAYIKDGYANEVKFDRRQWRDIRLGFTHFQNHDLGIAKITPCFENRKSVVFKNLYNNYGAGTTELHVFRPIFFPIISEYALYVSKTENFISNGIANFSGAVGQQRVGKDVIGDYLIALPPLEEISKILSSISKLFLIVDGIVNDESHLYSYIQKTKSKILDLAISGKLVPQDPNDEPASVLLERIKSEHPASKKKPKNKGDNSHYPFEIPKSWEWCYFEDISTNDLGKTLDKIKNQGKYYPYLRSVNVRWGEVNLDDLKEMKFEDIEIYRYSIEKGDLLVCEGGEVGRCAVWDRENSILYQNAIHRVRFHCKIDSYLYMYFLWHYNDIRFLDNYSKGVTIKHLTKSSLNTIPFPLPPLSEQKRIVQKIEEIFDSIDKIINSIIA